MSVEAPVVPETPRPAPRVSPSILEPARPEVFNFRFAADREFKEKFERLAEVLGVENPLLHMSEVMEQALDIALDKKDLKRKRARRLERKSRTGEKPCPGKVSAKSRYISRQGSHDERNLRLHCGPHNRLTAERTFGVAFIQGRIDPSRRKRSP